MNLKKVLIILCVSFIFLPLVSSAHYIVGIVEDAKDGTLANGHTVVMWNPTNGQQDNLTDIVGPTGNSGADNNYSFDCELLSTPCQLGDTLIVKILNNGDEYISENSSGTVGGGSSDQFPTITLNSPPFVGLINPPNFQNISTISVNFNCSFYDFDANTQEITLYGNWNGGWHANETIQVSGNGSHTFQKELPQGSYSYNCLVKDNLSAKSFATENFSFNVDLTPPEITSLNSNISYSCGESTARIVCNSSDSFLGIEEVVIQKIKGGIIENHSTTEIEENSYYADILLNETGEWSFNCISKDFAGNEINSTLRGINIYSQTPEIKINSQNILANNLFPSEGEEIVLNVTIENLGCSNADNFNVGFYEGDPDSGGINIENLTFSVLGLSSGIVNFTWNANIGLTELFIFGDSNDIISEENESNNKDKQEVFVESWLNVYGNISIEKLLGSSFYNMSLWTNESNLEGNVFIADSECEVNWLTLQAIGRTTGGTGSSSDFSEIDNILGMSPYQDSVSEMYSNAQTPKEVSYFLVHQQNITNVPIINSTNSSNFVTGILWDTSDDSDGEFDSTEKEDLVFVAKVNKQAEGGYGTYDYELKVPAKLREYDNEDSSEVYFYYDLN